MKLLLVGRNGFIGSSLYELLRDKYDVVSTTRDELDVNNYNRVRTILKSNKFDCVVNCAYSDVWRCNNDKGAYRSNISSFCNFVYNRSLFGKYVHFGSGAEFDITSDICNVEECDIYDLSPPPDPYGASKLIISKSIDTINNFYTLRLFGCFGPKESRSRLLGKYLSCVQSGKEFILTDRYFDYFYVNDIVPYIDAIVSDSLMVTDMNLVYKNKLKLSQFIKTFCTVNDIPESHLICDDIMGKSYTGSSHWVDEHQFKHAGIEEGLSSYFKHIDIYENSIY